MEEEEGEGDEGRGEKKKEEEKRRGKKKNEERRRSRKKMQGVDDSRGKKGREKVGGMLNPSFS